MVTQRWRMAVCMWCNHPPLKWPFVYFTGLFLGKLEWVRVFVLDKAVLVQQLIGYHWATLSWSFTPSFSKSIRLLSQTSISRCCFLSQSVSIPLFQWLPWFALFHSRCLSHSLNPSLISSPSSTLFLSLSLSFSLHVWQRNCYVYPDKCENTTRTPPADYLYQRNAFEPKDWKKCKDSSKQFEGNPDSCYVWICLPLWQVNNQNP